MPGSHASRKVVYAALAGNTLIAVTKFAASAYTGSSAMLSEAIHSVVDTGNQGLMLLGMRRAKRPADELHPFGYGMELYFWAFVVAIMVFAVGAGVSFYEGIQKLRVPHALADPYVNYIVLGIAALFEGTAWAVALREFRRTKGTHGLLAEVQRSKDPTVFTVLFEDTAALLGLFVAFAGIALGDWLDDSAYDAYASLVIGAILAATAMLLARECKGLLIGEGASRAVVDGIRKIVTEQPGILQVNELLTLHFGPDDVLLTVSLDFADTLGSAEVEAVISAMERRIKSAFPEVKRLFIEAQSRTGHERALRRESETSSGATERHG